MSDPYVYPGTDVLRNRLEIRHAAELNLAERRLVTLRVMQGVPSGRFDADHIRAIHHHLFQDVYEWAGQYRTVNIAKGDSQFHQWDRIGFGMQEVASRVAAISPRDQRPASAFIPHLAHVIGELNYVHPFREGNGRTQLQFARLLAERAGHKLDVTRLSGPEWLDASREAMETRYEAMEECFTRAFDLKRSHNPGRDVERDREP